MHSQSTNATGSSPPTTQRRCPMEHDWRLQGLVWTAKGQVEYYQCRRCLAPRHDRRSARLRQDRT